MRTFIVLIALTLPLAGCYEEIEPETTSNAPASGPANNDLGSQGGGSALGKAKNTAENTATAAEQHNQNILKQIEDPE
jgi:hypothetical protein